MIRRVRCPSFKPEVLDVGGARVAHPEAIQAEVGGQPAWARSKLGGEQERAESARSRPRAWLGWILGCRTYWAGFDGILPSMWAKR